MKIETPKFSTKKELFDYLILNKPDIVELKKSSIKFSDCFGVNAFESKVNKSINTSHTDSVESGIIKRTLVGNTYNWMDSHDDVHLDGVFGKSISERGTKILHLHDHEYKLTSKVGKPEKIYEKEIAWTDLGVNKVGNTQALFMDSEIKSSLNKAMFDAYLNNEIDQHSVGMNYDKIELAINDPEYKAEYATWKAYIDRIGNKEKATEKGFFWAVKEAKLREISAVLEGSNELTPTIQNIQPPVGTGKTTEPVQTTQTKKEIDYDYLTKNLNLNN